MFFFAIKFCLWTVFWWHLSGKEPTLMEDSGGEGEGLHGRTGRPPALHSPVGAPSRWRTHWVRTRQLSTHSTADRGPLLPLSPVPWGTRWSQTMVMLELGWAAAQEPRTTGQQLLQQRTRQAPPLGASKWCCDLLDRPHVTDSWRCWDPRRLSLPSAA